jgi:hypothetical protein
LLTGSSGGAPLWCPPLYSIAGHSLSLSALPRVPPWRIVRPVGQQDPARLQQRLSPKLPDEFATSHLCNHMSLCLTSGSQMLRNVKIGSVLRGVYLYHCDRQRGPHEAAASPPPDWSARPRTPRLVDAAPTALMTALSGCLAKAGSRVCSHVMHLDFMLHTAQPPLC